ncbi:hypothetical protein ACRAWF_02700 [Streptomyces sp. L7]
MLGGGAVNEVVRVGATVYAVLPPERSQYVTRAARAVRAAGVAGRAPRFLGTGRARAG